jgi:hypothetical protein
MRTFAQKENQPQKPVSSSLARPNMATLGSHHREHPIPHLQRTIGNQAVPQMFQTHAEELKAGLTGTASPRFEHDFCRIPLHPPAAGAIQTKLAINKPGDENEQEADRVADQVMRMPEPQLQRARASGGSCSNCQTKQPDTGHERLQAKQHVQAHDSGELIAAPIVHEVLHSSGQPLDLATRAFFEPRFGFGFSQVRIHHDHDAAESARALGAHAYTVANHVVFGAGRYALETPDRNRLLAHELTHVMQQHASRAPHIQREKTGDEKENEERGKLLTDFTDGAGLPEKQVARIAAAMRDFSLHQLRAMQKVGVRFWAPDSLPPEFEDRVKVKNISTPGEYLDLIHIIRMVENATTDAIRHELAHAWDHVRTGKVKPIGQLKGNAFEKAINETPALSSTTDEKRATRETHEGKVRGVRLTISEMLERYRRGAPLREQSFDNPSTRESYSKKSPREFYAEGYSVFHSGNEWNQARLLYYASELYELLETEAKQEGLEVPDRSKIAAAVKEQKLPD